MRLVPTHRALQARVRGPAWCPARFRRRERDRAVLAGVRAAERAGGTAHADDGLWDAWHGPGCPTVAERHGRGDCNDLTVSAGAGGNLVLLGQCGKVLPRKEHSPSCVRSRVHRRVGIADDAVPGRHGQHGTRRVRLTVPPLTIPPPTAACGSRNQYARVHAGVSRGKAVKSPKRLPTEAAATAGARRPSAQAEEEHRRSRSSNDGNATDDTACDSARVRLG